MLIYTVYIYMTFIVEFYEYIYFLTSTLQQIYWQRYQCGHAWISYHVLWWYTIPGLWTLCCSLSSIMHSHIWGKSDVICYGCIQEFRSSLIQTRGWIEGREERQFPLSILHPHTYITTLTRTSVKARTWNWTLPTHLTVPEHDVSLPCSRKPAIGIMPQMNSVDVSKCYNFENQCNIIFLLIPNSLFRCYIRIKFL